MPNSFMHHININGTNFEIYDKAAREALDNAVVETNNDTFRFGYWTANGTYTVNYIRLCNKEPIKVSAGDRLQFHTDGLYVSFLVFQNKPSETSQSYLEMTPYETGTDDIVYTIEHDGYLVFNMQNGPDWGSSTQPSSTKAYDAYLVIYRINLIKPAIDKAQALTEVAANLAGNIPTKAIELQIEKVAGFYNTDSNFLGGGTRIKCPQVINGIFATFRSDTAGTAYCEVLDENMSIIKTVSANVSVNTSVYFDLENLVTGLDAVWIRMYGEGDVIPKRSEVSIVTPEMISRQPNGEYYHIYKTSGGWVKTTSLPYCIPFIIYGGVSTKSITVGNNRMFSSIKSAVDYANALPVNEWDIFIDEGTYDIYSELGGDTWYSSITSSGTNMQGIRLGDNVNLIGIGNVVLQFIAPDSLATSSNVPNVSVLELSEKRNAIKNIKAIGKNVRYVIHDETDNKRPHQRRLYENVELDHQGVVSGTWASPAAFGCGFSSDSEFIFDRCIFHKSFLIHNNTDQIPSNIVFNNCQFLGKSYAVSLNKAGNDKCNVYFNNCFIDYFLRLIEDSDVFQIYGSGNNKNMNYVVVGATIDQSYMRLSDDTMYAIAREDISKFNPVELLSGGSGGVKKATSAKTCIGIAIESASSGDYVRVKTAGTIDCYGEAPFAGGTLFGVSANGQLKTDSDDPIGIVYNVDSVGQLYLY